MTLTRRMTIALTAAIFLMMSAVAALAGHTAYSDADQITPAHEDNVHEATDQGIVEGYDDGTFRPLDPITRQEHVSVVMRALDTIEHPHCAEGQTEVLVDLSATNATVDGADAGTVAVCMEDPPAEPTE